MYAEYKLKSNELDSQFLNGLKNTFKDKEIEIIVYDTDETDYLLQSKANKKRLLNAVKNVKKGKNLVNVDLKEFA